MHQGQVGGDATYSWLHGSWVLGAFVTAGIVTVRKRPAAVKATEGLLAGVGPLVRRNGALVGEAHEN